jgi:3-oxoacyl-[acyl-carrier protein] reductase
MNEIKTALVTGAASGIGLATSTRLARAGHRVLMVDRADAVLQAVQALNDEVPGANAAAWVADVGSAAGVTELVACLSDERVDMLVNNAGISRGRAGFDVEATTPQEWERVIAVNLSAPFLLCQALVPGMRRRGWGRIVNIASRAGRTGVITGGLPYAASKAGLIGMTRALALQCAPQAITANCIAPGWVQTPLTERTPAEAAAQALKTIPLGRVGRPEEIAGVVAFLCSDDAAYITGAVIDANGGSFMG